MSKKPYLKQFDGDVVRVARNREPGVGLDQIGLCARGIWL